MRPKSVTIVGALFLAGSLLVFAMALGDLVMLPARRDVLHAMAGDGALPAIVRWLSAQNERILLAQLVVAAIGAGSAIQFLRLRAWARTILEGLAWGWALASTLMLIGFGISLQPSHLKLSCCRAVTSWVFELAKAVALLCVFALCAAPLALTLRVLRSERVRHAMRR